MENKTVFLSNDVLAELLQNNNYLSNQQIEEFRELQQKLKSNYTPKRLDELVFYKELSPEKVQQIQRFLEFIQIRVQGIVFCQMAVAGEFLQSPEMERVLITQRSLFLLKGKTISLDELLLRKDKMTRDQFEKLQKTYQSFSQQEYDKLVPQAIAYLLEEDRRASQWRKTLQQGIIGTKYETSPKASLKNTGRISVPLVAGNNIQVDAPKVSSEDAEKTSVYELGHYGPSERHLGSTTKVAFIVTGVICFIVVLALLFAPGNAEKDFQDILYLHQNQKYTDLEKKCEEFCQAHQKSKKMTKVKEYWQVALLVKADIAQRQQRLDEAIRILEQADRLLKPSDNSEKIGQLLQSLNQQSQQSNQQQSWQVLKQNFEQAIAQKDFIQANQCLASLEYSSGSPAQKQELLLLQQQYQQVLIQQRIQEYRYYSNGEKTNQSETPIPIIEDFTNVERFPLVGRSKQYEPIVGNEIGFTIVPPYLYAFSASSGNIIWVEYLGQNSRFDPIFLSGQRSYDDLSLAEKVLVVSYQNSLKLIEIKTGNKVWETALPALAIASPILHRGKIYIPCYNQNCYQVDSQTGTIEGRYYTEQSAMFPVSVDRKHKILYITTLQTIFGFHLDSGKMVISLDLPSPPSSGAIPVFPYLIVPSYDKNTTTLSVYHTIAGEPSQLYSTRRLQQVELFGKMKTPGVLAGGLLAITTHSHLAVYGIHPTNPKEPFFTVVSPIALEEQGVTFVQFTNFLRNLIVIQKKILVYELPDLNKPGTTLTKVGELALAPLSPGNWESAFLPFRSGNLLFWTQQNSPNLTDAVVHPNCYSPTYQISCIYTDGKMRPIWQKQWSPKIEQSPIVTEDGRVCFLAQDGTIHEIYQNDSQTINYRMLSENAGYCSNWAYIPEEAPENEGKFVVGNQKLSLLSAVTGWPVSWQSEIPIVAMVGKICYDNGNIFFGNGNSVCAVSSKTGKKSYLEYSEFRAKAFLGQPIVAQNSLWIGNEDGNLYQLQFRQQGQSLPFLYNAWVFKTRGAIRSQPVIQESTLFIGSDDGQLYAIDTVQKKLLWQFQSQGSIRQKPLYYENKVYFASDDRTLYCLDATNGNLLWKSSLFGKICATPIILAKELYVVTLAGECYSYQPETGNCLKSWQLGTSLASIPVPLGKYILVVGQDGFVYILSQQ